MNVLPNRLPATTTLNRQLRKKMSSCGLVSFIGSLDNYGLQVNRRGFWLIHLA
jgi:hypothetical protein